MLPPDKGWLTTTLPGFSDSRPMTAADTRIRAVGTDAAERAVVPRSGP